MSESNLPATLDRLDLLLLHLVSKSPEVGMQIPVMPEEEYPVAFAHSPWEFRQMGEMLQKIGYVDSMEMYEAGVPPLRWTLTYMGWKRIGELQRTPPASTGNQCFVAMWFTKDRGPVDMEIAFDRGFQPAIASAGYRAYRVDRSEHNNKIDDQIIAEIRRSRLLVADFTGARGGVYFEAGFAMGLGRPVIWTCHKKWMKKLHFDTRQYNHIVWDSVENLRSQLENRIRATAPLS